MNKLFETVLLINKYPIQSARFNLAETQKSQFQRAVDIFNFHLRNSRFYGEFLHRKFPLNENFNWYDIPTISKKDFQVDFQLLSNGSSLNSVHVHNTSGSTGVPFYFIKDKFCHAMTWAYTDFLLSQHKINIGDSLQARFYGIPLNGVNYYKERFKDFIAGRYRFPVFNLTDDFFENVLIMFKEKSFVYLNGYTSSMVQFAKFLIKHGLVLKSICPSLRLAMPTSEVCDDIDRNIMAKAFGVKVVNEYGAAELDIIAMDDVEGDFVINEKTLLVEILDDNNLPVLPGEEGRVVVTSLYNKAMPFIRYELGDRAILSDKLKNGSRVLEKVSGRVNDFIKLPTGKLSPGLTFYYISKKLLERGGRIREFIIRQTKINTFTFEYVSDDELSENDKYLINQAIEEYLESGLIVEFLRTERIIRTSAGKFKHFFSEI